MSPNFKRKTRPIFGEFHIIYKKAFEVQVSFKKPVQTAAGDASPHARHSHCSCTCCFCHNRCYVSDILLGLSTPADGHDFLGLVLQHVEECHVTCGHSTSGKVLVFHQQRILVMKMFLSLSALESEKFPQGPPGELHYECLEEQLKVRRAADNHLNLVHLLTTSSLGQTGAWTWPTPLSSATGVRR
ncbi:hypothetical protein E2C01_031103 [Portunus trituberculatus]|uniref:Uncharacterized protein n=1 Tax=Portunus trituberculatus TaxID=210409 RepID=A0A5B7EWR8_PORTR|nr:hypothetical protein [Portunus trituberculatus]